MILLEAAIIAIYIVNGCQGVVPQHTVLDGQHRAGRFGVLEKQGIVAYAQAQHYVEVGFFPVENHGLKDGVAHDFGGVRVNLLVFAEADVFLGNAPHLADCRDNFKSSAGKNFIYRVGLVPQPHAEGQAEPPVAHLAGKFHDFFQAGFGAPDLLVT